jgi:hypothetical protein
VNITDGRWDQPLKVSEFLLECVVLTVFSDMRSITASFLLNLDCLVLPTFSFWLYVILHMSQSPLQRTPSSVCQRKIVWNAFTKSSSCWHFFRSRMSAGDQSGVEFDNNVRASRPIRSLEVPELRLKFQTPTIGNTYFL